MKSKLKQVKQLFSKIWNGIKRFISKIWNGIKRFFDKILPTPKPVVLENGTIVHPPRSAKIYISIILLIVIYFLANATYIDEYIQEKVNYKPVIPNLNVLIYYVFQDIGNIIPFLIRFFSGFIDGIQFWTPEFQYWEIVLPKIIETIKMAI